MCPESPVVLHGSARTAPPSLGSTHLLFPRNWFQQGRSVTVMQLVMIWTSSGPPLLSFLTSDFSLLVPVSYHHRHGRAGVGGRKFPILCSHFLNSLRATSDVKLKTFPCIAGGLRVNLDLDMPSHSSVERPEFREVPCLTPSTGRILPVWYNLPMGLFNFCFVSKHQNTITGVNYVYCDHKSNICSLTLTKKPVFISHTSTSMRSLHLSWTSLVLYSTCHSCGSVYLL